MLLALALLGGCGRVECTSHEQVLESSGSSQLTCGQVEVAYRYGEALAARPLSAKHRGRIQSDLARAFGADPEGVLSSLEAAGAVVDELRPLRGLEAAERRSTRVWELTHDQGPLAALPEAQGRIVHVVAVWTSDEAERLSLTEMDIEGWIYYGSLCREVQSAPTLRLSVADRVHVYKQLRERFDAASRPEQVAMVSLGAFWEPVKDAWSMASFEQQQGWIAAAPLPPSMTATSLGYATSLLEGDLARHATVLHQHLGPLPLELPSD